MKYGAFKKQFNNTENKKKTKNVNISINFSFKNLVDLYLKSWLFKLIILP